MILFRLYGIWSGVNFINVTDVKLAIIVLKQSNIKGYALEKHLALPAWAPILSLESIDGELWTNMRKDFDKVIKLCPDISKLNKISSFHISKLKVESMQNNSIIDAESIVKLTLTIFIEYLFNRTWEKSFAVFIAASWEWRKEIAIRGKGNMKIKLQAIDVLVSDLIFNCPSLWNVYKENWKLPQYYSLLLQPFILSPAINIGDIMVNPVHAHLLMCVFTFVCPHTLLPHLYTLHYMTIYFTIQFYTGCHYTISTTKV
jgi:hypothetical protein